ncbi:MAG: hypothetical protein R2764_04455 [Bacteroidales bacterium]
MHGYDQYYNSHFNRLESFSYINPMYNPEKLELMKHWLANHNEGSETGGLIVFSTMGASTTTENLQTSPHLGEEVVVEWGTLSNRHDHCWLL